MWIRDWFWKRITQWLTREPRFTTTHLTDYERLRHEIRPADVILVEGRSRISHIIKTVTLTGWTHAAIYIGRLHDIEDPKLREYIAYHCDPDVADEPLIIESLLESGTIVAPLSTYRNDHIRVCRPQGLSHSDAQSVLRYCISCLSLDYDIRQFLDLARFMFPFYSLLPRRWRSSLFAHRSGLPTRTVCSTMIADAFHSVNFPILPLLVRSDGNSHNLRERNTKLFTPADFDYSPYFEILKFPLFPLLAQALYRKLPWDESNRPYDDAPSHAGTDAKPGQPDTQPVPSASASAIRRMTSRYTPQLLRVLRLARH